MNLAPSDIRYIHMYIICTSMRTPQLMLLIFSFFFFIVRTLFTFDFFDHLKGLTHIKQLNACKCVYNWMQTETTSIETTAPLARWHKKLPFKPRSTDNKCIFLKPTIVKCAINNQPFILIEGYMGRFCLKCIDIYIINIEHNKESFNYTQFIFDDKADIEGTVVGKIEGFDYGAL